MSRQQPTLHPGICNKCNVKYESIEKCFDRKSDGKKDSLGNGYRPTCKKCTSERFYRSKRSKRKYIGQEYIEFHIRTLNDDTKKQKANLAILKSKVDKIKAIDPDSDKFESSRELERNYQRLKKISNLSGVFDLNIVGLNANDEDPNTILKHAMDKKCLMDSVIISCQTKIQLEKENNAAIIKQGTIPPLSRGS